MAMNSNSLPLASNPAPTHCTGSVFLAREHSAAENALINVDERNLRVSSRNTGMDMHFHTSDL